MATQNSPRGKSHSIPFKIISCSSENAKFPSSNLYSTIDEQEQILKTLPSKGFKHWESTEETTKVEITLALSTPTEIQSILIGMQIIIHFSFNITQ